MGKFTEILNALSEIGKEISKEKGTPIFFSAILPVRQVAEDTDALISGRFDLIVSGHWKRKTSERKLREFIFQKLINHLKSEQIISFLHSLVVLDPDQEFIKQITEKIGYVVDDRIETHGLNIKMKDREIRIEHGFIFYSLPSGKINPTVQDDKKKTPRNKEASVTIGENPNALGKVAPRKGKRRARTR